MVGEIRLGGWVYHAGKVLFGHSVDDVLDLELLVGLCGFLLLQGYGFVVGLVDVLDPVVLVDVVLLGYLAQVGEVEGGAGAGGFLHRPK